MTTTNDLRRSLAPDTAAQIAAKLAKYKITVPKDVRDRLDQLERLKANRPPSVGNPDIVAALVAEQYDQIEEMIGRAANNTRASEAWKEARVQIGLRAIRALTANADSLIVKLRKHAEPLIHNLTRAAAAPTQDIAALIRSGNTEQAELTARVDLYAGDLAALYDLRDSLTRDANYGQEQGFDCRIWRDPRPTAKIPADISAAERTLRGIRAGAELWFPSPSEAEALAMKYAAERRHRADERAVEIRKHSVEVF